MKRFLCFVLALTMCVALSGCGKDKVVATKEDFEAAASSINNYIVDKSVLIDEDSVIEETYITYDSDEKWQAEFYVLKSSNDASASFNLLKGNLEKTFEEVSSKSSSSKEINNYSIYSVSGNDEYYYLCRVENTIFYGYGPKDSKDTIKALADYMGY